jgi:hypothetical protein
MFDSAWRTGHSTSGDIIRESWSKRNARLVDRSCRDEHGASDQLRWDRLGVGDGTWS